VLILNHVNFSGYVNPYLYIIFILSLPFDIPKWALLSLAFFLGLSVDIFSGVMGLHTAAVVFMAFCRPGVLKLVSTKDMTEKGGSPSIQQLGFNWFFSYSFILVFIHHLIYFYLEVFHFSGFFYTLLRVILSLIVTLIFIFIFHYIFHPSKRKT
jgi:hypothetical protein